MAKMLNYRFRYKVTAPFRATFCFGFVTHHMHIKRGDQQWAAAIRSRISLVTSEALARRCASSLREAHSRAGSPWTQQNVFFTAECSCEQQAGLYQIQFVGVGLHFILLGFFFSFLHVNISANLSSGFLAAVSLEKKKKRSFVTYKTWKWEFQWRVGSSVSKILFAGVFWPRSRAQKMPQSLSVRNTAGIQAGQHSKLVLNRLVDKNYSAKEVMSNF